MTAIRSRIALGGRIVIPSELRRELGWQAGDSVVVEAVAGELRIRSLADAVQRAQALVRRHVPEGDSLVDALIAERRAEDAHG